MVLIFLVTAAEVRAQDVLMNSAETINLGNLKLAIFPTVLFERNGRANEFGVAFRIGYGITKRVDIEAKAAIFKDIMHIEYSQYFQRNIY